MSAIMLSAGNATRLDGKCKALNVVGGRTMLEHWVDLLGDVAVVCRSKDVSAVAAHKAASVCIAFDEGGGPARALDAGMIAAAPDEPLTVIYADTWVPAVPDASEFCGVGAGKGGRAWDVVENDTVTYRRVPERSAALVAIGLYRFARPDWLAEELGRCIAAAAPDQEVGLAEVVNRLSSPFVPVFGWQDVGDPEAKAAWRPL